MSDEVIQQLQERVAHLEEEVRQLKAQQVNDDRPWWEKTAGMFANDPLFPEFVKELRRQRREDYRKAREEGKREDAARREAAQKQTPPTKSKGQRKVTRGSK